MVTYSMTQMGNMMTPMNGTTPGMLTTPGLMNVNQNLVNMSNSVKQVKPMDSGLQNLMQRIQEYS